MNKARFVHRPPVQWRREIADLLTLAWRGVNYFFDHPFKVMGWTILGLVTASAVVAAIGGGIAVTAIIRDLIHAHA